jgi:hypothetical protein
MEAPKLNYKFWVELIDGTRVVWDRLTRAQAHAMWKTTDRRQPDGVKRYGWSEMDRLADL